MFMLSFRLSRGRVLLGALAVVLVLSLGYMGVRMFASDGTVETAASQAAGEKSKPRKVVVKTNEQRLAFAASFGYQVQEEPAEILEVIIPKEFDEVYTEYNSLQKKQGYDLEKFAGKRCRRYSYIVTNYPQAEGEIRLNILVYSNKVIGGDVCSLEAGGFMHGFRLEG